MYGSSPLVIYTVPTDIPDQTKDIVSLEIEYPHRFLASLEALVGVQYKTPSVLLELNVYTMLLSMSSAAIGDYVIYNLENSPKKIQKVLSRPYLLWFVVWGYTKQKSV